MKIATLALLFAASTAVAAAPHECQMKSAYVEFVISGRQQGMAEGSVPDLYGDRLDRSWKAATRHAIYSDANLVLSDPMRAAEQVYRDCEADRGARATKWRGTFSMPPSR
jgi:hypothetical protein